jgi:hypothetical protein
MPTMIEWLKGRPKVAVEKSKNQQNKMMTIEKYFERKKIRELQNGSK